MVAVLRSVPTLFLLATAVSVSGFRADAQVRLADESDRAAFRAWFIFLADAQFYGHLPEVTACSGLVRAAYREAFRVHTPEWARYAALPWTPAGRPYVRQK